MIPEWVTLGGGAVGTLFAAKWLWRGAALASLLKVVAIVLAGLAVLSVLGILDVGVNVSRVVELGSWVMDMARGLSGGVLA